MDTIQLRASVRDPVPDDGSPIMNNRYVVIRHPAYSDSFGQNKLLRLRAWDGPNSGLHAGTALLACMLIACNAWDGYLTKERNGEKMDLREDDIIPVGEYYFHVPSPKSTIPENGGYYKYPIYPTFQHWEFPHGKVPSQWCGRNNSDTSTGVIMSAPSISSVTSAVINRDKSCIVSKYRDYIERAHICPRQELDWFRNNRMIRYNAQQDLSGDAIIDDMANALALRGDIHRCFDDRKFVLVRKCGLWAVHFLKETYDLGLMYHNRPVEITGVSSEHILTRFAWAIFPLVKQFMEKGPPRAVKVLVESGGNVQEVFEIDIAGFGQMNAGTRGRGSSPKKRKAAEVPPSTEVERPYTILQPESDGVNRSFPSSDYQTDKRRILRLSSDNHTSIGVDHTLAPSFGHSISARKGYLVTEDDAEMERLSALRMGELRKRRPQDSSLICCDYDLAERANALGIPGKPEYGGAHLCWECLGFETRD